MPFLPLPARKYGILGAMTDSKNRKLRDCPPKPNCVCSDATDPTRRIAPLTIRAEAPIVWRELCDAVEALPRSQCVERTNDYLHAEVRSWIFGFVDDLEFRLRIGEGIIGMRSAARTGYSDLGVNRRRLERLRRSLRSRGLVD